MAGRAVLILVNLCFFSTVLSKDAVLNFSFEDSVNPHNTHPPQEGRDDGSAWSSSLRSSRSASSSSSNQPNLMEEMTSLLVVEQIGGDAVTWPEWAIKNLTYCIEIRDTIAPLPRMILRTLPMGHASFASEAEARVRGAFQMAANAWEQVAGVGFTEVVGTDGSCDSQKKVWFRIEVVTDVCSACDAGVLGKAVVAEKLLSRYFKSLHKSEQPWDIRGRTLSEQEEQWKSVKIKLDLVMDFAALHDVLMHEIGHVLGFAHTHALNPDTRERMCLSSGEFALIGDVDPLESFDPKSVMNWVFCGGTQYRHFELSPSDAQGARWLYGAPAKVKEISTHDVQTGLLPRNNVETTLVNISAVEDSYFTISLALRTAPINMPPRTATFDESIGCSIRGVGVESFCRLFGANPKSTLQPLQCTFVAESLSQFLRMARERMAGSSWSPYLNAFCEGWYEHSCYLGVTQFKKDDEGSKIVLVSPGLYREKGVRAWIVSTACDGVLKAFELKDFDQKLSKARPIRGAATSGIVEVELFGGTFKGARTTLTMTGLVDSSFVEFKLRIRYLGPPADAKEQSLDSFVWGRIIDMSGAQGRGEKVVLSTLRKALDQTNATDINEIRLRLFELRRLPLSLFDFVRIEKLDLSRNFLSSFTQQELNAFVKLENLRTLDLQENFFAEFPELRLPSLLHLDISHTGLEKIPDGSLRGLPKLRRLTMVGNKLSNLTEDISLLKDLEHLDCSQNQLRHLPVSMRSLLRLQSLKVRDNKIENVPDWLHILGLRQLDMCGNPFDSSVNIDWSKVCQPLLFQLQLSGCNLSGAFSLVESCHGLRFLDISRNSISAVDVSPAQYVEALNCESNHLEAAPIGICHMHAPRSILLAENRIKELPDCLDNVAGSVQQFSLSSNMLQSVPESFFSLQLHQVDLSFNRISILQPSIKDMVHTTTVLLRSNQLATLPSSLWSLPYLTEIDASDNRIEKLEGATSIASPLRSLDLSQNALSDIPSVLGLATELRSLDLSRNAITSMPSAASQGWSNLKYLDLSRNNLTNISERSIPCASLVKLLLSHNQIKTIPPEAKAFVKSLTPREPIMPLEVIDLSHNKLDSSFPMNDFFRWRFSSLRQLLLNDNELGPTCVFAGRHDLWFDKAKSSMLHHLNMAIQLQLLDLRNNNLTQCTLRLLRFWLRRSVSVTTKVAIAGSGLNRETLPKEDPLTSVEIILADKSDRTAINVDGYGLPSIPSFAWHTEGIKMFSMSRNSLLSLPTDPPSSTSTIEIFRAFGNLLSSFPSYFGEMTSLRIINLSHNHIKSIPPSAICPLGQLVEFTFFENMLEVMPDCWDKPDLQVLDLGGNKVRDLPTTLANATNLEVLDIDSNRVAQLVDPSKWRKLKVLRAGSNRMTSIPDSISRLSRLDTLNLASNHIQFLPERFRCRRLRSLELQGNKIHSLPPRFGRGMPRLKEVDLSRNQLHNFTAYIPSVRFLQLDYNQLKELPDSFGKLESLEHLTLAGNLLQSLPESFGDLRNLNFLALGDYSQTYVRKRSEELRSLPRNFTQLHNLKKLFLDTSSFDTLPWQLQHLKSLEVLGLDSMPLLNSLPEWLCSLPRLKWVYLRDGNVTSVPLCLFFGSLERLRLDGNQLELPTDKEFEDFLNKTEDGGRSLTSNLAHLTLQRTLVASLPSWVNRLESLSRMDLRDCRMDPAELERVRQSLPHVDFVNRKASSTHQSSFRGLLRQLWKNSMNTTTGGFGTLMNLGSKSSTLDAVAMHDLATWYYGPSYPDVSAPLLNFALRMGRGVRRTAQKLLQQGVPQAFVNYNDAKRPVSFTLEVAGMGNIRFKLLYSANENSTGGLKRLDLFTGDRQVASIYQLCPQTEVDVFYVSNHGTALAHSALQPESFTDVTRLKFTPCELDMSKFYRLLRSGGWYLVRFTWGTPPPEEFRHPTLGTFK